MNKQVLSATLFITSLILSPVILTPLSANAHIKVNSISTTITSILHKRGLDEDAAEKISQDMIGDDEESFEMMVRNIENGCSSLNRDEILNYLSSSALFKENVKLDSYSFLVSMVHKIRKEPITPSTIKELQNIEKKNSIHI